MGTGTSSESFRQGWQYFNRIALAQIDAIDTVRGTVSVVFLDGLATKREGLELPWTGFSMNGHRSSWIRYMPQISARRTSAAGGQVGNGGDLVYVGFGARGEARILGYATMPGMYGDFADVKTIDKAKIPYGDFIDLKQGEWDMRSSGGAHVFGDRDGALLLAAGPTTQLRLDKKNNEVRTEAGLWKVGGGGSFIKIGDVKRTLLTTPYKETDVDSPAPLDPTATKEFYLHLENFGPAPIALVDEQLGAVRDSFGAPYLSSTLTPLRYRRKIWDIGTVQANPVKTAAYSNEIDALGNQTIDYGLATTSVDIVGGPTTSMSLSCLSASVDATVNASISAAANASVSGAVRASLSSNVLTQVSSDAVTQVDAPAVFLGEIPVAAVNPALHGTVILTQLTALVAALTALANTKNPPPTFSKDPDYAPLQTALTAITAILAIPPGTPLSPLSAKVFIE